MANPKNPVVANFPVPPPSTAVAIGRTSDNRDVFLSIAGLELLQAIWAAIQGQGGILDLGYLVSLLTSDVSDGSGSTPDAATLAAMISSGDEPRADNVSPMTLMDALLLSSTGEVAEGLAAIPTLTIPANLTANLQVPLPATLSAILDKIIGNSRGSLIVRGASAWQVLPLGANGTKLTSNGSDAVWV